MISERFMLMAALAIMFSAAVITLLCMIHWAWVQWRQWRRIRDAVFLAQFKPGCFQTKDEVHQAWGDEFHG